MRVQLISPLSNQVGWRNKEYEGDVVGDIIAQIQEDFPQDIVSNFFEEDMLILKPFMLVFLNGQDVRLSSGLDALLTDGDSIQIAIALGGG